MNPSCYLSNLIWALIARRKWIQFRMAVDKVADVQSAYLLKLLHENCDTAYGRHYGFRSIDTVRAYQQRVPITNYEDYLSSVRCIRQGQPNILTAAEVKLLEPTSGTSSATKLIPYTDRLRAEFQNGIGAWVYNLFKTYPALLAGKAYWSITPNLQAERRTDDILPIGFNEDGEYFGRVEKRLIDRIMVGPAELAALSEVETFRYVTLLFLVSESELRMLSVWNPSYLDLILKTMDTWADRIVEDIRRGDIRPPGPISDPLFHLLKKKLKKNPKRATVIEDAVKKWRNKDVSHPWIEIWPHLTLISCWADGWANPSVSSIQKRFPGVVIQPKGLLATEALITFPLERKFSHKLQHVLSITSHFYEFEEQDDSRVKLSHELEIGKEYTVIVSTGGGLYRYRLNDRVRVEGHFRQAPLLRFIGKTEGVSDLYGEKVHEDHLRRTLATVFRKYDCRPEFYFVAPQFYAGVCRYTLFLESPHTDSNDSTLQKEIEQSLLHNFHYDYCRRLDQLGEFKIHRVPPGARDTYFIHKSRLSQLGTVKYSLLEKQANWVEILAGKMEHLK